MRICFSFVLSCLFLLILWRVTLIHYDIKNENLTASKQLTPLFLILLDSFQKEFCINFQKIGKTVQAVKRSCFHINQLFGKTDLVLGQWDFAAYAAVMFLHVLIRQAV